MGTEQYQGEQKLRQSVDSSYTPAEKVYTVGKIWSEVKYNYVNTDKLTTNLDTLYKQTLNDVMSCANDIEYHEILRRFMAALNDGHTSCIPPRKIFNHYDDILISIEELDKKLFITAIHKKTGMDSIFLFAEIIGIEDMQAKLYMEKYVFPKISASNEHARWATGAKELETGLRNKEIRFKLKKADGEISDTKLCYNMSLVGDNTGEDWWSIPPSRSRKTVDPEWQNNIAVLTVNSFDGKEVIDYIDQAMERITTDAAALILNIRNNREGWTEVAEHLLMYIIDTDSIRRFGYETRVNNGYGRSQGNYDEQYADYHNERAYEIIPSENIARNDSVKSLSIPVIVLIGLKTASAAEDFLIELYEIPGRRLLIGNETNGSSTGAPLVV